MNGMPLLVVSKNLGHRDTRMVEWPRASLPTPSVPSPASPGAKKAPAWAGASFMTTRGPERPRLHILRGAGGGVEREHVGDDRPFQTVEHAAVVDLRGASLRR
jgi:hypothetical protein